MLDAHPEIGCPAEVGIPALISHAARVWSTMATPDEESAGSGASVLSHPAQDKIRQAATAPMEHYCAQAGKRIYVDKSLDSVHHLESVAVFFPAARHILLFRHVMDTVASGLEGSPWGFQAYGYLPFVQASPENFVAALVNYWLTHVDAALRWEEAHSELCHRVRYEDLVTAPETTMTGVFDFLGVSADMSVLERAFEMARDASGPGDYKVTHTSSVHAASIGRGKRVPVRMIPPPLLEATNEKLAALGYEPLSQAWNAEPSPSADGASIGNVWSHRLAQLMRDVERAGLSNQAVGSFAVVAQDYETLRWVIDAKSGEVRQGDGEVESVVTGSAEDLVRLLGDEVNVGVLLRSGRIRHVTAREGIAAKEVAETMNGVLDVLRCGAGSANGMRAAAAGR